METPNSSRMIGVFLPKYELLKGRPIESTKVILSKLTPPTKAATLVEVL